MITELFQSPKFIFCNVINSKICNISIFVYLIKANKPNTPNNLVCLISLINLNTKVVEALTTNSQRRFIWSEIKVQKEQRKERGKGEKKEVDEENLRMRTTRFFFFDSLSSMLVFDIVSMCLNA